ncbi:hypothetical protein PENSPDRAFT_653666 [Peniophora sp. CONT]|nr:hypothetical protein PENSPDRAFT_653666 [Peniophora sp. CONT]
MPSATKLEGSLLPLYKKYSSSTQYSSLPSLPPYDYITDISTNEEHEMDESTPGGGGGGGVGETGQGNAGGRNMGDGPEGDHASATLPRYKRICSLVFQMVLMTVLTGLVLFLVGYLIVGICTGKITWRGIFDPVGAAAAADALPAAAAAAAK